MHKTATTVTPSSKTPLPVLQHCECHNSKALLPELRALAVVKAKTEGIPTTPIQQGTNGWNKAKLVAFLEQPTTTDQLQVEVDQIHDLELDQIAENGSAAELDQAVAAVQSEDVADPGDITPFITISKVTSYSDTDPVVVSVAWNEFVANFQTPEVRGALPLHKYLSAEKSNRDKQKDGNAIFAGKFSRSGTKKLADMSELHIIPLDIDESKYTFDELCNLLEGYECVVHTSYSHSNVKPKYRAYILLQSPIIGDGKKDIKPVLERIIDFFDHRIGNIDPASRKPAQLFYTPACPPGGEEIYQYRHLTGIPLDPADFPALPAETEIQPECISPDVVSIAGTRPGDDYNRRESCGPILLSLGWTLSHSSEGNTHYTRPGKQFGVSGTVFDESGVFYCHTSAAEAYPFECGNSYNPFKAYALVHHGGDYSAAARELATLGYGEQAKTYSTYSPCTTSTDQSSAVKDDPFISAADLLLLSDEKDTILGGIIEAGTTGQLFGPSGGGKTFVALDMALSIATGMPWNGTACNQGIVLYFAGEGHNGLRRRIKAWYEKNGKPDISHCHITRQAVPFDETGLTPAGRKAIEIAEHSGLKVSFIICDTLARHIIGDENSTQNMSEFVNVVDSLRKVFPGSTALIVHHTGNDSEKSGRSRGSSALKAACDFEILCNKGSLTYTKLKDGEPPPPQEFKLVQVEIGIDEDGDPITSCVVQYGESSAKNIKPIYTRQEKIIVNLLEAEPTGILINDLREQFYAVRRTLKPGVKTNTIKNAYLTAFNNLTEKQLIRQNNNLVILVMPEPSSVILPSLLQKDDGHYQPSSVISPYKGDDEMMGNVTLDIISHNHRTGSPEDHGVESHGSRSLFIERVEASN